MNNQPPNLPDLTQIMGKSKGMVIIIIVLFLLFLVLFQAMYTVDEGHVGIVKRFGEATEQVNPGLHVKIPFVDRIEILEIRTRKNVEKLNGYFVDFVGDDTSQCAAEPKNNPCGKYGRCRPRQNQKKCFDYHRKG